MAIIIDDISHTFHEYLLLPGLTAQQHVPQNVSLKIPIQRYRPGKEEIKALSGATTQLISWL